jgi:ectoine hydroxylase-related dioxygenase (phytanoyl-CoA dioxygenase family)
MVIIADDDLSLSHRPITETFTANILETLSASDCLSYDQNGYLAGIKILDADQIAGLRVGLKRLMKPEMRDDPRFYEYHHNESEKAGSVLFHALGAWRVSELFHDLIFHPTIIAAAEKLLRGPVRFWHDQLFVKPAFDGGIVAWHQDYSYWTRTTPMAHLTCWIGLDDSTIENGCVNYVPGSHRWPLLPRTDLAGDMEAIIDVLTDEQRAAFTSVPVELSAGYASFHHPMTVHGSYANRSPQPRRAIVLNYIRDGVQSDTDEPLLAGVPPTGRGNPLGGQFFPLVSVS